MMVIKLIKMIVEFQLSNLEMIRKQKKEESILNFSDTDLLNESKNDITKKISFSDTDLLNGNKNDIIKKISFSDTDLLNGNKNEANKIKMININKSEEDEIKTTSQILKKFSINNISSFAKNIIATNIKK